MNVRKAGHPFARAMASRRGVVGLLLLAATACGHAPAQATPGVAAGEVVPVYREPMHREVFHSPLVRVLDVRIPAGDTTAYHVHAAPLVGIAVQDARIWSQTAGAARGPVSPLPDGPARRLLEQGPTVRVYQITLAPGAATDPHTYATPGLTVLSTAGTLSEDGSPRARGGSGAGSWSWREAPYRHVLRNDGPTPLVVYEID